MVLKREDRARFATNPANAPGNLITLINGVNHPDLPGKKSGIFRFFQEIPVISG
ncbi:hypothetical protein HDC91_003264 [Mucilaginibacter sp. AK015]|nr:hypothetical protein [Mucilaginibacter sp. AK015]